MISENNKIKLEINNKNNSKIPTFLEMKAHICTKAHSDTYFVV